jgi:hypothetical protein
VEMALYHRAIGYTHPGVKVFQHRGEPVIVPYEEHHPPDVGAITLWLANRRADRWRPVAALARGEEESRPIAQELRVALQRATAERAKIIEQLPPSRARELIDAAQLTRAGDPMWGTLLTEPIATAQDQEPRAARRWTISELLAQVTGERSSEPTDPPEDGSGTGAG